MTDLWSIILGLLLDILNLHVLPNNVSTELSLRPPVPGVFNFKTASLRTLRLVFSTALSFLDGLKFVVLLMPLGLSENMVGLLGMDLLRNKQLLSELVPYILKRFGFNLSVVAMLKKRNYLVILREYVASCEYIKRFRDLQKRVASD